MTPPIYTATVTNLTRGWTLTATHTVLPDPGDRAILIDPLTFDWGFENDTVPSVEMDPSSATFNIAALSADDVPDTQIGDAIQLDVRIGTSGARIIRPYPMRVSAAPVTLRKHKYAALLAVSLTDLSADWKALEPAAVYAATIGSPAFARPNWRPRMAEVGNRVGVSVGCPTWWADGENPAPGNGLGSDVLELIEVAFDGSAQDNLDALLNSHQPAFLHHTWVTVYSSGHPSGYEYVGPSDWHPPYDTVGTYPAIPEPGGMLHVEAVPASRRASGAIGLPLAFAWDGTLILLVPRTPPAGVGAVQLGLDGKWCELPAQARRGREQLVNTVNVKGKTIYNDGSGSGNQVIDYTVTVSNDPDVAARGVLARNIDTQLTTPSPSNPGLDRPEAGYVGLLALSDDSVATGWAYDGFTMQASLIPDAIAAWLAPLVAARFPGETDGDGQLVRQVTVFNLDPQIRFDAGQPVSGFIAAGSMTIAKGDITWTLIGVPGKTIYTDYAPTPVTLADVNAGAYGAHPLSAVDPLITIADLDYVDA